MRCCTCPAALALECQIAPLVFSVSIGLRDADLGEAGEIGASVLGGGSDARLLQRPSCRRAPLRHTIRPRRPRAACLDCHRLALGHSSDNS